MFFKIGQAFARRVQRFRLLAEAETHVIVAQFGTVEEARTRHIGDADGFDQGISQWSVQVGFKYEF